MIKISAKDQMIAQYKSLLAIGAIDQTRFDELVANLNAVVTEAKKAEVWDRDKYGDRPFKSGYSYKGLYEAFDMTEDQRLEKKWLYFAVYFDKVLMAEFYTDNEFNGVYRLIDGIYVMYSTNTIFNKRSESRDEFTNSPLNKKRVNDPWHYERDALYHIAHDQREFNNSNGEKGADFWASLAPVSIAGVEMKFDADRKLIQPQAEKAEKAQKAETKKAKKAS